MANNNDDNRPLKGFDDLLLSFSKGEKPKDAWRIGTEHEKFVFHTADLNPVAYEGPTGIGALLSSIQSATGWEPIMEEGHIIGLKYDGASITLEPGGQFELSGAPLVSIHETCNEVSAHLTLVRKHADALGIGFLGLGFQPSHSLSAMAMMPKGRYKIMRAYMEKVGRLGREMMFRSCTVQTNLDFSTEADMAQKMRVSMALQPLATALFANSPFAEGRTNGYQSYRAQIWTDTDPDRTGILPFVFKPDFGYHDYANWVLDAPMYFVRRDGQYHDVSGLSFRAFMEGKLKGFEGQFPTRDDWEDHLTTVFPEVRLKSFIEMRGADSGPWSRLCALPAFWVGLLYDQAALDAASDLIKDWKWQEVEGLRRSVGLLGLDAYIGGQKLGDIAKDVMAIARQGLKNRAALNGAGDDESGFLSELDDIVRSGANPAQRLLTQWDGPLAHDMRKLYELMTY